MRIFQIKVDGDDLALNGETDDLALNLPLPSHDLAQLVLRPRLDIELVPLLDGRALGVGIAGKRTPTIGDERRRQLHEQRWLVVHVHSPAPLIADVL